MKIIHTADWHLGKQLLKYSLQDDQQLFLDWLATLIQEQQVDLLLVSGDIFDTAFPSTTALNQYYSFLHKLIGTSCEIVITGGNHDSPGVLNAPKELLDYLNIKVVGSMPTDIGQALFAYENLGIAVAAVPFLRETDLRSSVSGISYEHRLEAIRDGIKLHYERIVDLHQQRHPHLTLLGMGHLYVNGAEMNESERDIHSIGGLAAFSTHDFPKEYDYIALGHIHKPQQLAPHILYSGSPIPLSFSERNNPNYILELTLEKGDLEVKRIDVPRNRELKSFKGTLEEVKQKLATYQTDYALQSLVEVLVEEEMYDPALLHQFDQMILHFNESTQDFKIIKPKLSFLNRRTQADELYEQGTLISELTEKDVFERLMEHEEIPEENKVLLQQAFNELMYELSQK